MATQEYVYEHVSVPRRHGPAFGATAAIAPAEKKEPESRGSLDKRSEAALGVAIVVPTAAGYAALAYGCYLAVTALF
jgi:hypothetical protein